MDIKIFVDDDFRENYFKSIGKMKTIKQPDGKQVGSNSK